MNVGIVIELTGEQSDAVEPLVSSVEEGGATIAQVYTDGMRVRNLTAAQAKAIAEILGADTSAPLCQSAEEAHQQAIDIAQRRRLQ